MWLSVGCVKLFRDYPAEKANALPEPVRSHEREVQPHRIEPVAASALVNRLHEIGEEHIAGHVGHSCRKCSVVECHRVETLRQGQEKEETAFRMGPAHALRHILLKFLEHYVPLFPV